MSRILQWILGILALVVIVGLVLGALFMWRNQAAWGGWGGMMYNAPGAPGPDLPQAPDGPYRYDRYPRYHMDNWGGRMPMHGYAVPYAMGPFQPGFLVFAGLMRLVLPLGVLALVAYLFYQMGKRAGAASPPTPAPASMPDVKDLPSRKVARG